MSDTSATLITPPAAAPVVAPVVAAPVSAVPPVVPPAAASSVPPAADPAAAAIPPAAAVPGAEDTAAPDWRKMLAGDDTEALKSLERFATAADYHKSFTEAQKTIRARQEGTIKLLGENATDEEKASFSKALGIPEAPDKYERVAPPEGLELAPGDQSFIDKSIQKLHGMGGFAAHPEVVKTYQALYHEAMQERAAQIAATAIQKKNEGKAVLTKVYGQNLALEMKHAENAVAAFGPRDPEKMRSFLDRQMLDGTTLGDDPEMVQLLVRASRATHEDPMLLDTLSGGLPTDAGGVQAQIDDIMKLKGTPAYDAKQDQLRALLAQRERISGKG